MAMCKDCAFLQQASEKSNCICSILKLKKPFEPGYYIRNKYSQACAHFKVKQKD